MPTSNDTTLLICLFHHSEQAQAAIRDLQESRIPADAISVLQGGSSQAGDSSAASLETMDIPERDIEHLRKGLAEGGTLVSVWAEPDHVDAVEDIFEKNSASKIDEINGADGQRGAYAAPFAAAGLAGAAGQTAIPIVEEDLVVGKRNVGKGGVRVYRRVVEIPVEESVNLREEHVQVDRRAVDRPASAADLAASNRTIELTETAEEAIVSKTARVVEEVKVGKVASERVERVQDTVRRTEVEVEEIPSDATGTRAGGQTL